MFKAILLLLLLGFACAAAMMLIQRLNSIASQLGGLRREIDRKNEELERRVAAVQAQERAQQKAQQHAEREQSRSEASGRVKIEK